MLILLQKYFAWLIKHFFVVISFYVNKFNELTHVLLLAVCSAWNTYFRRFWKLRQLETAFEEQTCQTYSLPLITLKEFFELIHVGGRFLISVHVKGDMSMTYLHQRRTEIQINGEKCSVIGILIKDLAEEIIKVCNKIESLTFNIFFGPNAYYEKAYNSFHASIQQIFRKNPTITMFRSNCKSKGWIPLQNLPQSIKKFTVYNKMMPNVELYNVMYHLFPLDYKTKFLLIQLLFF